MAQTGANDCNLFGFRALKLRLHTIRGHFGPKIGPADTTSDIDPSQPDISGRIWEVLYTAYVRNIPGSVVGAVPDS